MHKFKITNEIKSVINEELINSIEKVSIPEKILSLTYDFLNYPEINGNELILGFTKNETTKNYLFIDLIDFSVNHKWNYSKSEIYYINSSIEVLEKCLLILDFYINDLIEYEELGEYDLYHEKYAVILQRLVGKVDSKSINNGFWRDFIEEMKLGVI
jgi:hypothetical protein